MNDMKHWLSGLSAVFINKWTIISAVLSEKIVEANAAGAFNSPESTWIYLKAAWWYLLKSVVVGLVVGSVVSVGGKANYLGRVAAGTQVPPSAPVVVPPGTTVQVTPPVSPP